MTVSLYDSMTKTKKVVAEIYNRPLTVYTCGPTVYLDPHIGNWRTFIFYDTLVRVLRYDGADVKHVLNITDVGHLVSDDDDGEDKLDKQAKLQRKSAWEIAEKYTAEFLDGMKALNMLTPTKLPKATDHIREQIAMVQEIEKRGFTYKIDDGIYFDTSKLKDYGKLAHIADADEPLKSRIGDNKQKKHPHDFALWKFSPKDEKRDMEWESPWGVGFPGWHLECSVMANKYLGTTLDIHAGGVDHIPIHHTNEIAQSEVVNGTPFAHIWCHAEFMKVDGTKMSKSLGNVYTLNDIEAKGFSALDFRMLVLQGQYRTETNFSWENLEKAAARLKNIYAVAELRWQINNEIEDDHSVAYEHDFMDALRNDLDTPKALEVLAHAMRDVQTNAKPAKNTVKSFIELLVTSDKTLGLNIMESTADITKDQKQKIIDRDKAKQNKDYEKSDKLRDQLIKSGIELNDTPLGSVWHRIR